MRICALITSSSSRGYFLIVIMCAIIFAFGGNGELFGNNATESTVLDDPKCFILIKRYKIFYLLRLWFVCLFIVKVMQVNLAASQSHLLINIRHTLHTCMPRFLRGICYNNNNNKNRASRSPSYKTTRADCQPQQEISHVV